MKQGIIIKGIGGFYYVKSDEDVYECRARGKFKNINVTPLVGDYVDISVLDDLKKIGVVEEVHPRKTELLRPSVSNVDQAIIVFSIKDPMPNMMLLDKMLVLAENSGLEIVICFNKGDLDSAYDYEAVSHDYRKAGYTTLKTCAITGEGVAALSSILKSRISVFSGPSGVGKSSLLNAIEAGFTLKTGAVSEKIKRGKHTTRHSELMELKQGGWVVDTPGFTSLSMLEIDPDELWELFPDIRERAEDCRFDNCLHLDEPGCAVKEAVFSKELSPQRYESYVYLYKEIVDQRRKFRKW
ncbi:ribosome small subunit-dependent GTPase A [Fusibacter tunisiensis]|uniref:Small ribosomal subunit biogenesis GTPase RsgA n=1 Tax=Fusibacter tunisiensis TaxID=1008308 RepID=A0ABS2MMB5_9FIRM|nr:ribosome small subunit-dependent GTPase A [Fusibacter tunisiensis]MBM7560542.1 ribosome biogenesis GTPase [Fusibacter tunisiensis]